MVIHIVLLLAHEVVLELIFDGLGPLDLGNIHVVAGVLYIFAALLLPLESLVTTLAALSLLVLCLNLLLYKETEQSKNQKVS